MEDETGPLLLATLGERVKAVRLEAGISQEALAARSGVHRTYVSLVERGVRNCRIESISRLCKGLDISLGDFFDSSFDEI